MSRWLVGVGLGVLTTASGCYSPGGGLFATSTAQFVYPSTEMRPITVTMVNTVTNEPFFVQVVPPGQQLTIQFLEGGGDDAANRPDRLIYEVQPLGTTSGTLANQMTVPPSAARRIDVDIASTPQQREVPENERYRVDDPQSRPGYWSPQGGPRPSSGGMRYD